MKSLLRRSRRLRSARAFVAAYHGVLRSSPNRIEAELEAEYAASQDPWRYSTEPSEHARYATALEMLKTRIPDRPSSLEIGCGEGFFTDRIAPLCGELLAVDFSPTALARARKRCASHENASFRPWNLVRDAGLGTFDLVICMDVLEYVPGPCAQRQAIEKVVSSLAPGGALLISGVLQAPHVENAGWSRWLPIGARARSAQLRESLSLIEERTTERHLVSLFRAP